MNAVADADLLPPTLLHLAAWLREQSYAFVTVTPATHARILGRRKGQPARDVRDAFGWSLPFPAGLLPSPQLQAMQGAGLLQELGQGLYRSAVRFSTLGSGLFAHSAYPTDEPDAVFFGPDTYRFVALVEQELARRPLRQGARILDVGCGSGAGGIMAALASSACRPELVLADINARALRFAGANAASVGVPDSSLVQGDLFAPVRGEFDLILANPPFLNDEGQRLYRHGGGRWGEALSERIVREGLARLAPGGRLVLYTGVAIVQGQDPLLPALLPLLAARGWQWSYRELDPDVFGEELENASYAEVERIAVTALVVRREAASGGPGVHSVRA